LFLSRLSQQQGQKILTFKINGNGTRRSCIDI
jgi:hypothetical protein